MTLPWFDAHLDLACMAVRGRDMDLPPEQAGGPHPPAAVTLPSLREGNIQFALATIFTAADGDGEDGYPASDPEAAHRTGVRQLDWYQRQFERGTLRRWHPATGPNQPDEPHSPPRVAILIENADPIRSPDELPWWRERGVVAVGMAWWKPSRYAGGNQSRTGLTPAGRDLVQAMDELGLIHDLSHLSQWSVDDLLSRTARPVMASHSNCRALLGGDAHESWQRHLSDEIIREIARRGGMIGLNLYYRFLLADPAEGERPPVSVALDHVEHICAIAGHRRAVGLGSDMDGGLSALEMCEGIQRPRDLIRLAEGLSERGWSDEDIAGFTHQNWLNFLQRTTGAE